MNNNEKVKQVLDNLSNNKKTTESGYLIYDLFQFPGKVVIFSDDAGIVCDDVVIYIKGSCGDILNWISQYQEPKITESRQIKATCLKRFPLQFCEITVVFDNDEIISIPSHEVDEFFMYVHAPGSFTQLCLWDKNDSKRAFYYFVLKPSYGRYLTRLACLWLKRFSIPESDKLLSSAEVETDVK